MPLKEELERQGNWLFRRRSHLPLLTLPVIVLSMRDVGVPGPLLTLFSILLSAIGLALRCITVGFSAPGTSGRNAAAQKADSLNSTGPYSLIRHPLYVANFLMVAGVIAFTKVGWLIAFTLLGFWLYYERIMFAEEEYLRAKLNGPYLLWAQNTPAVLPRFTGYRGPNRQFDWRKVLGQEYRSVFLGITAFTLLELVHRLWTGERPWLPGSWIVAFVAGCTVSIALRIVAKKTRFLHAVQEPPASAPAAAPDDSDSGKSNGSH